jgi:hypothetical protein
VATLGANTFSGAQTAPAFVGDGSGLTNVPLPAGSATLGANTFSGTQTAPAFVGDGSGLTNLPFPAGAATLGANTFAGTQTINAANLDLDPTTAATGMITKNGTRFLHNFGGSNTFLGENAGNLTTTGVGNTGNGLAALQFNTDGIFNTAIGHVALRDNTGGNQNTAIGAQALGRNTGGSANVAAGNTSLLNNSTGAFNTSLGWSALQANTNGDNNAAIGASALFNNTGDNNVAIGFSAGIDATTGSNNIYLGADVAGVAGESNAMYLGKQGVQTKTVVAGVRNTPVINGEMVLIDVNGRLGSAPVGPGLNSVGSAEVIDGSLTASDLAANSVGTSEVAFNYAGSASEGGAASDLACVACVAPGELSFSFAALGSNTFSGTQTINGSNLDLDASTVTAGNITKDGTAFLHNFGNNNTFVGINAGNLTTTGNGGNTASGFGALQQVAIGSFNTASGIRALNLMTNGSGNTATGTQALRDNTTGNFNTATGIHSLENSLTTHGNTAAGAFALQFSTGTMNTAFGYAALLDNSTGSHNVAVGDWAGADATTGSNNIYLGADVRGVAGEENTMYLGKRGTQTRTFIAGVRGVTTTSAGAINVVIDPNGQLGTVSSSRRFKEDIHDMGSASRPVLSLRPVTFRYSRTFGDGAKPIQYGLIAEEVAEVFPELAIRNADGQIETVQYQTLSVLLLNEMQQQQKRIESLERQVAALISSLRSLRSSTSGAPR